MKNEINGVVRAGLYNPTLMNVNKARERQEVIDPEKGPGNKKRKDK